jgi:hypothetical protein
MNCHDKSPTDNTSKPAVRKLWICQEKSNNLIAQRYSYVGIPLNITMNNQRKEKEKGIKIQKFINWV